MGRPKGSKNKPKDPLNQAKSVSLSENAKKNKEKTVKGNPTAICSKCRKEFQQEFKPEMNAYTSYKLCEDCRQRESYDKQRRAEENGETVFNALLNYTPFPAQQEMHKAFENHRFLVLNCVLPGQIVQGCNKPIEKVLPGDKVISHKSRYCDVERVTMNPYKGSIYEIKTGASTPIKVTSEHPIFVAAVQRDKKNNKVSYKILKESFLPAERLHKITQKDYRKEGMYCFLKIPRVKGTVNTWKIKPEEAFFAGVIRSCEQTFNNYEFCTSCDHEPSELFFDIMDKIGVNVLVIKTKSGIYDIKIFGDYAEEISKKVEKFGTDLLMAKDDAIVENYIKGFFSVNPYVHLSESELSLIEYTGYSERFLYQIQLALVRLGCVTTLKLNDYGVYCIKIKDSKSAEIVGFKQKFKNHHCFAGFFTEDGYYTEITSVKELQYNGYVYDLTTTDHSFTVNNLVVHNCGNRTGKDRFSNMAGIIYFVECLNENRHIDHPDIVPSVYWWIIAPTETMAMQNWRELKKFFPKDWVVSISNTTMTMQTIGGGMIEVRSAYDPESLVGVGLDLVTITEAARIKDLDVVWANLEARLSSPGRGREKDRRGKSYGVGKAIINSSPIGKNYFYTMWTWGQPQYDDYSSDWVSFSLPWTVNPANAEKAKEIIHTKYGDITYEESLRRRIGDRMYRQNYLADFLAGSGQVFADFQDKCCEDIYSAKFNFTELERLKYIQEWQSVKPYRRYRASWDIATGSSEDSPVLMIRDMEENKIVKLVDLYGKDYDAQYETIAYWCKHYNNAECVFSSTGHTACVGQLLKRGVSEVVVNEGGGNKTTFVINAQCACQNGDIHFLMDGSVEAQRAYAQIVDYTEHQNGKYSNESEAHDDWASALYLNYYDYQAQEAKAVWIGTFGTVDRDMDYFW